MKVELPCVSFEQDHVVFSGELSEFSDLYKTASKYGQLLVDFRFAKRYFMLITDKKIHVVPTSNDCTIFDYYERLSEIDNK